MPNHCIHCNLNYPTDAPQCLTCGRPEPTPPGAYPNVSMAEDAEEIRVLESNYAAAYLSAQTKGTLAQLQEFERTITNQSYLITACNLDRLNEFTQYNNVVYPVFLNLVRSKQRYAGDDVNNRDRLIAEEATLPGISQDTRFAALTINDQGLLNYGNYFLIWNPDYVVHRTSMLISNCLTYRRKKGIPLDTTFPKGNRSTWDNRHKLAVVKHESDISPRTTSSDFAGIILQAGASADDDEFIEAHIWGPITRNTLIRVIKAKGDHIDDPSDVAEVNYIDAMFIRVKKNLTKIGLSMETRP